MISTLTSFILLLLVAGPPVVYQIFNKKDVPTFSPTQPFADLAKYCVATKEIHDTSQLIAKQIPINHTKLYLNEYSAVRNFLRKTIPNHKDSVVIRVASYSHAMGPIMLGNFTLDGALVMKDAHGVYTFYLIQYNDSWTHGCTSTCMAQIHKDEFKHSQSNQNMRQHDVIAKIIQSKINSYKLADKLKFEIITLTNCAYFNHKIPPPVTTDVLLQQTSNTPGQLSHDSLIQRILRRELQGFIGK